MFSSASKGDIRKKKLSWLASWLADKEKKTDIGLVLKDLKTFSINSEFWSSE